MPNISINLIKEFNRNKELYSRNKKKIIESFKDTIASKYDRNIWEIVDVEVCYDEYMKNTPVIYEWVEISKDEYDYDIRNRIIDDEKWKLEYEYEPEFKERYFRKKEKKYEYLRIWVHESWGCSGHDDVYYDFLLKDILDKNSIRKYKLEKLEKI